MSESEQETMTLYISENDQVASKPIALDDLILTTGLPTTGGSKMLEGYQSLFEAEVVTRLKAARYSIAGKANTGEFGIDLLDETSAFGACVTNEGTLTTAITELVREGAVEAALRLDVNGSARRAAACGNLVNIKPTYGIASRFGTIAIACSGEAISVTAATAGACREVLETIAGHDDKDGTSLPQTSCDRALSPATHAPIKRVAISRALTAAASSETQQALEDFAAKLRAQGIDVVDVESADDNVLATAYVAWNILMSAELCNNVSRFDGVKYGHRTRDYETIGELYTNSRTEGFGDLTKTLILFGSQTLSTEEYDLAYDKALRVRRLVCEATSRIFETCDAILVPACSKQAFRTEDVEADQYLSLKENRFTAPANISGLPVVVTDGMQLIGPAFSDAALLALAETLEKEAF